MYAFGDLDTTGNLQELQERLKTVLWAESWEEKNKEPFYEIRANADVKNRLLATTDQSGEHLGSAFRKGEVQENTNSIHWRLDKNYKLYGYMVSAAIKCSNPANTRGYLAQVICTTTSNTEARYRRRCRRYCLDLRYCPRLSSLRG